MSLLQRACAPIAIPCIIAASLLPIESSRAQVVTLPSETPAKLQPTNDGFEYVRRDVMIAVRDGVKLHTVILVPKGARNAPILLTRTPYDATGLTTHAPVSYTHLTLPTNR